MVEKEICTGCSACYAICPKNCIDMVEHVDGFLYPQINSEECINCGLCTKVCPINKQHKVFEKQTFYHAFNKDYERHKRSSSGGIFVEMSDWVLAQGGIVVGAVFDDTFLVQHVIADDIMTRDRMLGSKYLQSNTQNCYASILEALSQLRVVLFSGTACQIAGIQEYLRSKKQSDALLYTVEVVCHGVGSPKLFMDFLKNDIGKKEIEEITFTSKKQQGEIKGYYRKFKDQNEKYTKFYKTAYGRFFLSNYSLRNACYQCQYSRCDQKISDIVIGDLWGKNISKSKLKSELGVSIIIVNNEKGHNLFQNICDKLMFEECGIEEILQPNLLEASEKPIDIEKFWKDYKNYNYPFFEKKWNLLITLRKRLKDIKKLLNL